MKSFGRYGFFLPVVVLLFGVAVMCQQATTFAQQENSDQAAPQAASEPAPTAPPENAAPSSSQDFSGTNFLGTYDSPAPEQANEQQRPAPGAAPVLGHPLDPADVDTLTGKNDQRRQAGPMGGAYYAYPMTNDWFGTPQFGTRFWGTPSGRFFSPFMFGGRGIGGRGFRTFGPTNVFFAPPAGTSFFLGGQHFATPGMFAPGRNWNFGVPPQANVTGSPFGPHHQP